MAWKLLHVVTITYHRRWVAQVIRPGWPAATDTMAFMHRVSGWLGRLSVGRKLMLIYLLDLSAVIYVSSILIHEKYVAIDFTRKEIVGTTYAAVLRDGLMGQFLDASQQPPLAGDVIARLTGVRKAYDEQLRTQEVGERFSMVLGQLAAKPPSATDAQVLTGMRSQLLREGRELLTTVGNQSNLILDPDLDSYYGMSLVVLRFPELLQAVHDTVVFLNAAQAGRGPQWSFELLTLVGRLDAVMQGIEADYNQAFIAGSPEMRAALQGPREALHQSLEGFQALLQGVAAGESRLTMAQGGTQQMQVLGALRGCILSLVTLVARQIAKPLQQLARVADEVRKSGDHTLRAHWVSRDEIGRLVTAFNEMLSQLDRDRVLQQELAASARAAEAQRELVEAFPIPMVVTSVPEHEVLHSNAPAAHWLGDRKTDPWAVGLEPGVRARFFQRLADQGSVDEFEVRWKGTAEPSWAVLSARRLQFQGRDSVLTAFTPINVLKVMEQRLELWSKVFEASSEGIIIMNADQQIISVNKAFCRCTHYDFYEVIREDLGFLLEESGAEPLSAQMIC